MAGRGNPDSTTPAWVPLNFLALPPEFSTLEGGRVVVLPVPYDATVSGRGGAREGPLAIIHASKELEVYDLELDADVSQVGIHTTPFLEPDLSSPEAMVERVRVVAYQFFAQGKLVVTLGGDHSVTIGAVKAAKQVWSDLSVLYLDAHADMRDSYMGTRWGHASTARRIQEMCPITLVGVRSMSEEEQSFLNKSGNSIWTYTGAGSLPPFAWLTKNLSSHVYISVDLDVFDPPLMAAVGTPEPGGPSWHEVLGLLKEVARHWHVVGFDATELAPQLGPPSCSYIAAKLVYKMMAYTCFSGKGRVV